MSAPAPTAAVSPGRRSDEGARVSLAAHTHERAIASEQYENCGVRFLKTKFLKSVG